MLYQRILTAIPLALLIVWIIFYQSDENFFYWVLLLIVISAYEWANLSQIKTTALKYLFAFVVVALTWLMVQYFDQYIVWFIYLVVILWLFLFVYLKNTEPKVVDGTVKVDKLLLGCFILPVAAIVMYKLHLLEQGALWLFYVLSLVWLADIGAYFSGKKFGQHKLAPKISPGKTIEGMVGGLITVFFYSLLVSIYFKYSLDKIIILVLLSILTALISITGDLYLSLLKRESGLKDSGKILPGHGGLLDRIDSALAALPIFYTGFYWLLYDKIL